MADSEKVGIDWKPILNEVKKENQKIIILTRNRCSFFNPTNIEFSHKDYMLFLIFETTDNADICLFRKSKNVWAMRGKGKIRIRKAFILDYYSYILDLLFDDSGNTNLSNGNINNILDYGYLPFKASYDSEFEIYYNELKTRSYNVPKSGDAQFLYDNFYTLINENLFNPIMQDINIYNDYALGLHPYFYNTEKLWIHNDFGKVFFNSINGLYTGGFLNSIPKTKADMRNDFLNANNLYEKNMYTQPWEYMVGNYGNLFTIDDMRKEFKKDYNFLTENDVNIFFNIGNSFTYYKDDIHDYVEQQGFSYPELSDWTWGWCNAINMLVFNSTDYENNQIQAEEFEKDPDNYIPPDNAQVTTVDENGTPNTTTEKPDEENPEDESKDKKDDKDSTNFPTTLDSTTSATLYEITHEQLNSFINYFWGNGITADSNILELLQGLYGNISEAVLGVNFIPINLGIQTSPKGVKIGRLETTFQWQAITDNVVSKTIGSIDIKPQSKRKTFFDYAPYTEIKLYLPYLGIIDLDTNSYMDTTLTVKLIVDVASGNASYALLSDGCLYDTFTFQLGISIPFTLSNGSQIQASYMQNAISCSLAVVTTPAKPVSGIKTIGTELSALTDVTVPSYNNKGSISGASTLGNCQNCILYIKRPIYNRPSNYGRMVGFPVNKTFKLSTLKGYTVCENAKIASFDSKPTDTEYNEIISLLEKGVII